MSARQRAWVSAVRYVSVAVLTSIAGWLAHIGEIGINQVHWTAWATLAIAPLIEGLNALGAVMNQSWSAAKQAEVEEQK